MSGNNSDAFISCLWIGSSVQRGFCITKICTCSLNQCCLVQPHSWQTDPLQKQLGISTAMLLNAFPPAAVLSHSDFRWELSCSSYMSTVCQWEMLSCRGSSVLLRLRFYVETCYQMQSRELSAIWWSRCRGMCYLRSKQSLQLDQELTEVKYWIKGIRGK